MQGCAEAEGSRELTVKSQKEIKFLSRWTDKVTVWTVELVLNMNHFSLSLNMRKTRREKKMKGESRL